MSGGQSLIRRGDLDLDEFRARIVAGRQTIPYFVVPTRTGHLVSRFGIGTPITAAPFFAGAVALGSGRITESEAGAVGRLAAATCVALAAVLLFATARALGVTRRAATLSVVTYGLATSAASIASQALWQHGPAQLWMVLAIYLLTVGRAPALAGLAGGMVVLCRTPDFPIVVAGAAYALYGWRRTPRAAGAFVLGALGPALLLATVNQRWFGAPWHMAQAIRIVGEDAANLPADSRWAGNPLVGLAGLLASPSRGLLVYSPILLMLVAAPREAWRRTSPLIRAHLVGGLVMMAMLSVYYGWYGGWNFGPRMLADLSPLLALALAPVWDRVTGRARVIAFGLLALSIVIHTVGVWNYCALDWDARPDIDAHPERLWSIARGQLAWVFTHRATLVRW